MINAWSLAGSILNGTFEKDYPIMDKTKGRWSEEDEIREMDDYKLREDDDGLDYEVDMSTIDDQYAHHFAPIEKMDYEPKRAHFYKYHEEDILKDIEEYVSGTYKGHYTGNSHEYRNVQTLDLMASKDLASGFCQANILKYGSRYGNKDGKNKKDLMKVIHYAMLLAHFDGHYGEPSMPSGNFEQMP